jgi:hypothetical protein
MPRLDPVHVFTFKAGLLSRVAHDLQLSLSGGELEINGTEISARIPLAGMRVDGVMRRGRLDPMVLSPKEQASIVRTATHELLSVDRHPDAVFTGRIERGRVRGSLSLGGRAVAVDLPIQGARLIAEIKPSAWGIKPYKAMMGAIRLQDRVRVEITLPAGARGDA